MTSRVETLRTSSRGASFAGAASLLLPPDSAGTKGVEPEPVRRRESLRGSNEAASSHRPHRHPPPRAAAGSPRRLRLQISANDWTNGMDCEMVRASEAPHRRVRRRKRSGQFVRGLVRRRRWRRSILRTLADLACFERLSAGPAELASESTTIGDLEARRGRRV